MLKDLFEKAGVMRGVLMQVGGGQMLLPNAAVAEVATRSELHPAETGEDWYVGTIEWRGMRVPVVAIEPLLGRAIPEGGGRRRIAVCHSFSSVKGRHFIGIQLIGMPQLVLVEEEFLAPVEGAISAEWPVALALSFRGQETLVPDLQKLGARVATVLPEGRTVH